MVLLSALRIYGMLICLIIRTEKQQLVKIAWICYGYHPSLAAARKRSLSTKAKLWQTSRDSTQWWYQNRQYSHFPTPFHCTYASAVVRMRICCLKVPALFHLIDHVTRIKNNARTPIGHPDDGLIPPRRNGDGAFSDHRRPCPAPGLCGRR